MIKIITDNSEIYHFLESNGNMLNDFFADKVLLIEQDDDCYVILFSSVSRNFILFKAENYLQETDALPILLNTLQEYPDNTIPSHLIEEAMKLVENKMHSKNNSRFFFDAH